MKTLPTLDQLLGLDKYALTYSQRCDVISLYNHAGATAAEKQAKIFNDANIEKAVIDAIPEGYQLIGKIKIN